MPKESPWDTGYTAGLRYAKEHDLGKYGVITLPETKYKGEDHNIFMDAFKTGVKDALDSKPGHFKSDTEKMVEAESGARKISKEEMYAFIPVSPQAAVARIYGKGAGKYDETPDKPNWREGYAWSNSFNAAMRHLTTFWNGEDIDPEMGESHLAAVVFHCYSMMEFATTHPELDDRYKGPVGPASSSTYVQPELFESQPYPIPRS